ncbi:MULTISPECIES: ribonuclease E activity regulator RraA [Cytobacillus]|uniref:4-hydroxy-4-methyl-2-oxoglutarate aldolase n=3 Tax=Cytobacillus TaxID=2675230 RepID=A0A160M7S2_9BACI|nr:MULTISPECIES: ribonuclease E activity regulator RraA [Cytobacillus]EFV75655.1 S-adenosylmethionine:2-demethylmenaquinone methyltransferase [Bacillus sp. 2_A_57_CT2]AND38552.1 ribonuclease [Cytobacillus oceanisediminis 2691]MBU8730054.1 ribonuclease E activity regulator RraA [Cytobacillus oceanisediminis]MBU8770687.1 ribonuclease E activity regulator RraA [Cytobacillus oceanisediminis]MCM3241876.1 ribonuclease E activity regulator RraA [Cytobacillus oceanisediminis]
MDFKTADLCDDHSKELLICQQEFKSYGQKRKFSGPISTVRVFEDNVLVVEALESIPEGSVLVVDGGGSKRCALMGDRLGEIAQSRKLAGVIIYGCVRDTVELGSLDTGILALGSNPLKSRKEGKGDRNIPVTFGGIDWKPGEYVYADEDGVIVSSKALI